LDTLEASRFWAMRCANAAPPASCVVVVMVVVVVVVVVVCRCSTSWSRAGTYQQL
jgi:hypothetical protein